MWQTLFNIFKCFHHSSCWAWSGEWSRVAILWQFWEEFTNENTNSGRILSPWLKLCSLTMCKMMTWSVLGTSFHHKPFQFWRWSFHYPGNPESGAQHFVHDQWFVSTAPLQPRLCQSSKAVHQVADGSANQASNHPRAKRKQTQDIRKSWSPLKTVSQ